MELDNYVTKRLVEGKIVNIKITGRKTEDGYLEMDWLIDNKFILKDMPSEVFEGEELIEDKSKLKIKQW